MSKLGDDKALHEEIWDRVSTFAKASNDYWSRVKLISIRIPSDAATARTPESEEDPTPKLFIPPAARVAHLIKDAQMWESAAKSEERAGDVNLKSREARLHRATRLRVKAICIHLGIEEEVVND